jgi:GH15 family glucan-1,4-alpha-glucosidase
MAPPATPPRALPLDTAPYPPIEHYALISDCESSALVGRHGSIDWCCMPTFDADPCFGRLLDWQRGGHCRIAPAPGPGVTCARRYVDGTMVLATRFSTPEGSVLLHDFFAMRGDPTWHDEADHLARLARCEHGRVVLQVEIAPRFDFGAIVPRIAAGGPGRWFAWGGNKGLLMRCSRPLAQPPGDARLVAEVVLEAGQTLELSMLFLRPEAIALRLEQPPRAPALEQALEDTLRWWAAWERGASRPPHPDPLTRRSALVLKALCFERTGAIAAAATTSLPEAPGGTRNWDYRFSWVRDSVLAVSALQTLGYAREADRFRAFIERSSAGSAGQVQLMVGIDGRRRLTEEVLPLEGWRGARPVRIGNEAASQTQLDVYGDLLELAWLSHDGDEPIEPSYWAFLVETVDVACRRWVEPDHGIWEVRATPAHFVHSKVMCWVAIDRGIRLARSRGLAAPLARWHAARDALRAAIERHGLCPQRGAFRQAFGDGPGGDADGALLLLPMVGFVGFDDPRVVRTVDWIVEELATPAGLLRRYARPDGLPGVEGVFLPCTFWLATCLARQGRLAEARAAYDRAAATANDLGLFAEEALPDGSALLGNFPQALTHLAQIGARLALDQMDRRG